MSKISIEGNASGTGTLTIAAPNTNTNYTLALPEEAGTITTSNSPYSTFRNRIINGDMRIDQRNAGASSTTVGVYTVDRWNFGTGVSGKMTYGQNYNSLTPPVGFTNYMGFKTTSAHTVGASEFFLFAQPIEGLNVSDLAWGSASAKTITLSFLVNSSLTGTFGGVLSNSAQNRSYPFTYTISSANTWETKTVTIAGDTTGTWLTTNGVGIYLYFGLGVGSTYNGTAGAWAGATYLGATGATSVVGTLNATWNITGVQLEVGSVATPFERLDYGRQLIQCERYFWRQNGASNATIGAGHLNSTTDVRCVLRHPTTMRANPTVTFNGSDFSYSEAGSVKGLSSLAAADLTPQTILLYSGAGTVSGTTGNGCFWVITSANSSISISAEL